MHPKQLRHLMSNPHALLKHQMTGRAPGLQRPDSPLIRLLESMTAYERLRYRGVRLSPELGYQCGLQFHNAAQLLKWLKPDDVMLECDTWPAEQYRNKRLVTPLTVDDLKRHCTQHR